jgi:hypothetical protein
MMTVTLGNSLTAQRLEICPREFKVESDLRGQPPRSKIGFPDFLSSRLKFHEGKPSSGLRFGPLSPSSRG